MKSFYKLIVSISCLFALSSCEGYLDVEQPSIYTDQNYYKTPQDLKRRLMVVMHNCRLSIIRIIWKQLSLVPTRFVTLPR